MSNLIIKFFRLFLSDTVYRQWKHRYLLKHAEIQFIIDHPNEIFGKIYHIKDDTWETMHIPAIYKMTKPCDVVCFHEAQDILRIRNAKVYNVSDVVNTEHGVVWDKTCRQDFSKIIPLDSNYLKHDMHDVYLKQCAHSEDVSGDCLSLLGVHADIWGHFLIQFLPKLYYAEEAGLFNKPITVLLPKYRDANIIEMVNMVLDKYNTVTRIEVENDVEYRCENLMYMPTASYIGNHFFYTSPWDIVIPQSVSIRIQSNIVNPLIQKVKDNPVKHEKIYLPRINSGYRQTPNISEIDDYFRSQGFHFIEGSRMTLEEKADIFMHAKIIVGPYSSAWINTIFCRGAKGLVLSNIPKSLETYYVTLAGKQNIKFLHVQGYDMASDHQTDFYMPIERVKAAYKQLIEK